MQSYSNPEDCPSRQAAFTRLRKDDVQLHDHKAEGNSEASTSTDAQLVSVTGRAVLIAPEDKPSLPRSGTLGLRDADAMMSGQYANLIGIVGLPNAGKTACIASLYLLLARRMLNGFSYANSRTLMALDEIASGTRIWNDGNPPDQMTIHTELTDVRQAGFLHLRLRRDADGRKFDLLMPDLPGEWSRTLLSNGEADRFGFLKGAEVIWFMVDGRQFVDENTRQLAIYQITHLIERIAPLLPIPRPRTILVASWRDKGEFPTAALERVQLYGKRLNFMIEFASIASFSDNDDVSPGIGLAELIATTLTTSVVRLNPWPVEESSHPTRAFFHFGKR